MTLILRESGVLPIGVEYEGELHRAFTIRPLKAKDSHAVRHGKDADICDKDDELMGLALLGRRIEIIGIPTEAQDLAFMRELYDADLTEILTTDGRLEKEIARFREETAQTDCPGAPKASDPMEGGTADGACGGDGVAGCLGGPPGAEESGKNLSGETAKSN